MESGEQAAAPEAEPEQGTDTAEAAGDDGKEKTVAAESEVVMVKKRRGGCKEGCKDFMKFVWNSETKEFMGRGARRWALLAIFYIIFYIAIAAFFAAFLAILLSSLDNKEPKLLHKESGFIGRSKIQTYPSVIFIPVPNRDKNPDTDLVIIKKGGPAGYWGKQLEKEKSAYDKEDPGNFDSYFTKPECQMNKFGYNVTMKQSLKPAIFMRISKILKYNPRTFTKYEEIDTYIKDHIKSNALRLQAERLKDDIKFEKSPIPIICAGDNDADDNLIGKIEYCTPPFLEESKLSFKGGAKKKFLPPFVMIRLPNLIRGMGVTVSCYPVAKGFKVDKRKAWAIGRFEVLFQL